MSALTRPSVATAIARNPATARGRGVQQNVIVRRALLRGLLALLVPSGASAAVRLDPIGTFNAPVHVASLPGDPDRLLVVEQGGTIQLTDHGVASTFLDLTPAVVRAAASAGCSRSPSRPTTRAGKPLRLLHPEPGRRARGRRVHGRGRRGAALQPAAGAGDPAPDLRQPQRRSAAVRARRDALRRHRRRRGPRRPVRQRAEPRMPAREDPPDRPAARRAARRTRSRPTTRSPDRRSGPTGCATPGASRSTA